jgi:hypothetical protein
VFGRPLKLFRRQLNGFSRLVTAGLKACTTSERIFGRPESLHYAIS